ncbi:DNA damage-binding protein CMR1-like [Silene latifolia]|uniref:DNA damage-binding protein CMR1-like n=1 Tax=Silene latifolia TaxID=37657 RepID=UPI003D770703
MVETMEEVPMTEYERRRIENIKRNGDMLSSLNINSILSNLTDSSLKRLRPAAPREWQKRIYERSRSSLRTQGIPASHPSGLSYDKPCKLMTPLSNKEPITMRNVYNGDEESHYSFVKRLKALEMNPVTNVGRVAVQEPVKLESFKLESENVTKIVPEGLTVIRILPTSDTTVVVAGNRFGCLGVWEATSRDANNIGKTVHLYRPHSAIIYGIYVHPFSPTKIYSCCGDGLLRMMDVEREEFDLLYSTSSGSAIYSLSQPPDDANSVYIGESLGGLNLYDGRAGKIINSWLLHKDRINSIAFNPSNTNVLATASTDALACLWDLRKMNNQHSECKAFKAFTRETSIHSAYFSPSGSCLAITSSDHMIAVLRGADFEDNHIIYRGHSRHFPNTCSRAIWGWDDTYLYMGCKKRRVEVLSVPQRKTTATLESSLVSSIPFQFHAHPCKVGMLVGAASWGKAFLWTSRDY